MQVIFTEKDPSLAKSVYRMTVLSTMSHWEQKE